MKQRMVLCGLILCLWYGMCAAQTNAGGDMYAVVHGEAKITGADVREVAYDQFKRIQESGVDYVLIDVRPKIDYDQEHIPGSVSLPADEINTESAGMLLSLYGRTVIYGDRVSSTLSTDAARKLLDLGYQVLDYKGGLQDWREHGETVE